MSVGGRISGLCEAGKQYLFYIHHSFTNYSKWRESHYLPNYGCYEPVLTISLEPGDYTLSYINPADLRVISERTITSGGSELDIKCPGYNLDLLIKIIRR